MCEQSLIHSWWDCKLAILPRRAIWQDLSKCQMRIPFEPVILLVYSAVHSFLIASVTDDHNHGVENNTDVSSHSSVAQKVLRLHWFICSRSHKAEIQGVAAWPLTQRFLGRTAAGSLGLLAEFSSMRLWFWNPCILAGCGPGYTLSL